MNVNTVIFMLQGEFLDRPLSQDTNPIWDIFRQDLWSARTAAKQSPRLAVTPQRSTRRTPTSRHLCSGTRHLALESDLIRTEAADTSAASLCFHPSSGGDLDRSIAVAAPSLDPPHPAHFQASPSFPPRAAHQWEEERTSWD